MTTHVVDHVSLIGAAAAASQRVLTPEALDFVARLHRRLNPTRQRLLQRRAERWERIQAGTPLGLLSETAPVRDSDWRVAPAPPDLDDRRVEITGPVDRKMMINALNSGAKVFMADFEDALSPTWSNVLEGQVNLMDAVRRRLVLATPDKTYELKKDLATLVVRPRGWHLTEAHLLVDGSPVSASLF